MKNNLGIIILIIAIASIINIVTVSLLFSAGIAGSVEYGLKMVASDVNNPIYRILWICSGIISFVGIILMLFLAKKFEILKNIETAESELIEEKEKYKKATQELVKMKKIIAIV